MNVSSQVMSFHAMQLAAMPREIALKIGLPIPFSAAFSKDYLDQLACDLIVSPDGMAQVLSPLNCFTVLIASLLTSYCMQC